MISETDGNWKMCCIEKEENCMVVQKNRRVEN